MHRTESSLYDKFSFLYTPIIRQQLADRSGVPVSLRQIWTWRAKAKARLAEKLREFI